jgi:antitoxin component YwqK of YwqJK toxin-antitoxin module
MKNNILIACLFAASFSFQSKGQEVQCIFNPYNKIGSNYFFSTYWNGSQNMLMDGICIQYMSNSQEVYEKRIFKKGIIQLETTNYINPTRKRTHFERVKHDSTIATYTEYAEVGHLQRSTKYYLDQSGRRCWEDSHYYSNGKLNSIQSFAAIRAEELRGFSSDVIPEHTVDSEGYAWQTVPIGVSKTYFQNGKLNTISTYGFTKNALAAYDIGLHGPYESYNEEGVLVAKGQYANGRANGEWRYYFFDGRLSEVKTFKDDFGIGTWIGYHYSTGKVAYTEVYDNEKYYWPVPKTTRYNEKGQVVYEKEILLDGKGYVKSYFDNGLPNDITIYYHGPSEISEYYAYFETGQLKRKTYYRAKNDTLSAEYFEDGSIKHLNLTPNIGGENTKQCMATYYSPGKMQSQSYYTYKDGITDQHMEQFYENGNLKYESVLHEKEQTERDFYENGRLKSEKHYVNDLLTGNWIQKDSLGTTMRNCYYSEGFKLGKCEIFQPSKITSAPNEEFKVWRAAVVSTYMRRFYNNSIQDPSPSIVEKEKIDEEAEILCRVVEYCNQNGYTFLPNAEVNIEGKISYTFNAPISAYEPHEQQIDSILISRGFTITKKMKQGGYCSFELSNEDYHGIESFNEMFNSFFPFNSGYFNPNNSNNEIDFGLKGYGNYSSFNIERRENQKAYLVTLYNYGSSKIFTLYEDGDIEFYNGRGDWSQPDMSWYQHMWWD